MRVLKFILMTMFLAGCSSVALKDQDHSLPDIQKAISMTFPKGISKISPNRRTFISHYFNPDRIDAERTTYPHEDIERERASVIATILGDRRPYDVEIEVLIEEDLSDTKPSKDDDLIDGKFIKLGKDKGLAKYFRERLANHLARMEHNKNIIDDFRPF